MSSRVLNAALFAFIPYPVSISSYFPLGDPFQYSWASLVTQLVKNPPAMRETWVRSLSWEDTLEKGTATHSSILAWRIPWTEESGRLQSMGSQSVGYNSSFHHQSY